MKKFVKYTALTALVLTIVGVVLLSIGAIGGSVQGIKTLDVIRQKVKAGEFSINAEDINRWMDDWNIDTQVNISDNIKFVDGYQIYQGGTVKLDFEAEEVSRLEVSLTGSNIEIKESKDDDFHVEANSIGKMQIFTANGVLHIIGSKTGMNIVLGDVVIQVPEDTFFDEATMEIGAGAISADVLQADEVEIGVGAGEFTVEELFASELTISVGAGEAVVEDGVLGDVKADVGAGAIDITANITGDVDADVAMGDLTLLVKGSSEKDHNYNIDCAMGEVNAGEYSWGGLAGSDIKINNDASTTYDLDCAMGSLNVKFAQ